MATTTNLAQKKNIAHFLHLILNVRAHEKLFMNLLLSLSVRFFARTNKKKKKTEREKE